MARCAARLALPIALTLVTSPALANDGVAQFAAGGLVQLGKEPRVVMARERLFISLSRVRVEYQFLNESAEDVVTEVAFPIPPYDLGRIADRRRDELSFQDWNGTVDGERIQFRKQVRAFVGTRDVTDTLNAAGIDFERFGGHDGYEGQKYTVPKLPDAARSELRRIGALDPSLDDYPRWSVAITYHWTQRFPAGRAVTITHEYSPVTGNSNTIGSSPEEFAKYFPTACLDRRTAAKVRKEKQKFGLWFANVEYILTTANTWKKPIRDFELVVERDPLDIVSFCWDGKVVADGATRFVARAKDFEPKRELDIYFIRRNR